MTSRERVMAALEHRQPDRVPVEVYAQVTERLEVFGQGGGHVFATVHNVQAKSPSENIEAVFQALRDNGGFAGGAA